MSNLNKDWMPEEIEHLQRENAKLRAKIDSFTFLFSAAVDLFEDTFANQLRQQATEQEKTDE